MVDLFAFLSEQWLLVMLLAVLIAALVNVEGRKGGQALTHNEVTRLLNDDSAVLVDVRPAKEFKAGHIVNAINIPFANFARQVDQLDKHKDKTIVVVDKMGQHSGASGKILRDKGFEVKRLQGGMMDWTGKNLPVVTG